MPTDGERAGRREIFGAFSSCFPLSSPFPFILRLFLSSQFTPVSLDSAFLSMIYRWTDVCLCLCLASFSCILSRLSWFPFSNLTLSFCFCFCHLCLVIIPTCHANRPRDIRIHLLIVGERPSTITGKELVLYRIQTERLPCRAQLHYLHHANCSTSLPCRRHRTSLAPKNVFSLLVEKLPSHPP